MAKRTETKLGLTFGWKPNDGSGAAQTPNWMAVANWLQATVINIVDSPPPSPAQDARFLVSSFGATGEFAGHENAMAWNDDGTWRFFEPKLNYSVAVDAFNGAVYAFNGTTWVERVATGGGGGGTTTDSSIISVTNNGGQFIRAGQPVCKNGILFQGAKSLAPHQVVLGLAVEDCIAGYQLKIQTSGMMTMPTVGWDAVADSVGGLINGSRYYIDSDGKLTAAPPETSPEYLIKVGVALNTTSLLIDLDLAIKL